MEYEKKRVLAYCVAKVIDTEEMSRVSGGSVHWTNYSTVTTSAASIRGLDVQDDVRVDW